MARRIVRTSLALRKDDRVCVVTDQNKLKIASAVVDASSSIAEETVQVEMPVGKMHGDEPSTIVAGAMRQATVVFTIVTYAITHTDAFRDSLSSGARAMVMRGVTEDMMLHGAINVDYRKIHSRSTALSDFLRNARLIHVESKTGTNLDLEKSSDRPVFTLAGIAVKPGTFAAMPDGEVALSPLEETANGTIVFDYSIDGIGKLREPIRLAVKNGRIEDISGGKQAGQLRRLIEGAEKCGTNVAEFAVGTNPRARLVGNLAEDKKKEGTVHIALGDNHVLGGTVSCDIHLDGLITSPSVTVDGGTHVINDGKLIWKNIRMAAR